MSAYGSTTGTREREPHRLMEPLMAFTLANEVDFRLLLSVLRAGARLDEQDGDARASLEVVDGTAQLALDGRIVELEAGQVAVLDAGRAWTLMAVSDAAVL